MYAINRNLVKVFFVVSCCLVCILLLQIGSAIADEAVKERQIDSLTRVEIDELNRLESLYFLQVKQGAIGMIQARVDDEHLFIYLPERIKAVRQNHRYLLLDIERYLFSLKLNPLFITSYIERLREDVVYYALEALYAKNITFPEIVAPRPNSDFSGDLLKLLQ